MTGSKELTTLVRSCMRSIQTLSGRPWREVSMDECPRDRLDGFDSYASVEATTELEKKLGRKLDVDTLFYNGRNALTLRDVCSRLERLLSAPT